MADRASKFHSSFVIWPDPMRDAFEDENENEED